jgi:DNA-binding CsgD family transcriptional regulator
VKRSNIENEVSEIIGEIYDCAVDPGLWTDTLGRVVEFCGGQAGVIGVRHVATQKAEWINSFEVGKDYVSLHTDQYYRLDPICGMVMHDVGYAVPLDRLMRRDALVESQFYREWAIPQSLVDSTLVLLEKSVHQFVALGVMTDEKQGRVNELMNSRLTYLAPHLHRAHMLGNLIEAKQQDRNSFANTLDSLATGVLLLDQVGWIVHANPAARDHLTEIGSVYSQQGRLMANYPEVNRIIQAALNTAQPRNGQSPSAANAIAITSRSGGRYMLHTLPLTANRRLKTGVSNSPVAAVFISPVEQRERLLPEIIGAAYKLTPTELRVLLGIVEVGGIPDVADLLGLAASTVKTHLGRIYAKTGVNRQADLVRLVAGFASPLVHK